MRSRHEEKKKSPLPNADLPLTRGARFPYKAHLKTRKDKCNSLNRPVFSPDQQARQSKCESQDQVSHHNIAATIVRGWCESVMLKMIDRGPEMPSSRLGATMTSWLLSLLCPVRMWSHRTTKVGRGTNEAQPHRSWKKNCRDRTLQEKRPWIRLGRCCLGPANGSPGSPAVRQSPTSCRCNRRHHESTTWRRAPSRKDPHCVVGQIGNSCAV